MIIYLLVLLSGFTALVYQVLWMKQLGLLFGNTSHAAGATLAAFFAGLAAGSWFWGKRSSRSKNTLRIYAGLELGVAATALLYFVVLGGYHAIYPQVYQSVHSEVLLWVVRFVLALLLIFPPAFCMGGTIPVMGQYVIRAPNFFGSTSAMLYAINTLGATLGALLAGFFMPMWFGFRMTCWLAIGLTLLVAAIAFRVSRKPGPISSAGDHEELVETENVAPKKVSRDRINMAIICFMSGFGILALEVLWTRMLTLVLENSVYTFAAILVIVLLCLAGGSLISSLMARRKWSTAYVLPVLLLLSGITVMLTPSIFMAVTDSFQFIAVKAVWVDFVIMVFQKGFMVIGPPALVLGAVFPYLMKVEEKFAVSPGRALGRLATINTIGAIVGSLVAAFLLLEVFGLWRSMQIIAAIYFLLAVLVAPVRSRAGMALVAACLVGLVVLCTFLNPSKLPATGVLASRLDEETLKTWEGSDCTVSVVRGDDGIAIKINSDYGLGSTDGRIRQACQAEIPLMLKPDAKSIFFLGMGTGISAGAALDERYPQVERVVTCELSRHVIEASKEYMTDVDGVDMTNGLFSDPRSEVLVEDGRHYLMATQEKFDIIDADLFVPYRSGAGNLYTKEHFECVHDRLTDQGIFVQWLPAYQVTELEFHVIGRTMLEVFDQVSLWRCDFALFDEVVAFVGHKKGAPLPHADVDDSQVKMDFLRSNGQASMYSTLNPQTALVYYCGNVTASKDLFMSYPINTDDKPVIEYMAPRQYRNAGDEEVPWFVGPYLLKFIKDLQVACPPDEDPLLVNRTAENRRLPLAGSSYYETLLWARFNNSEQAQKSWRGFVNDWLNR